MTPDELNKLIEDGARNYSLVKIQYSHSAETNYIPEREINFKSGAQFVADILMKEIDMWKKGYNETHTILTKTLEEKIQLESSVFTAKSEIEKLKLENQRMREALEKARWYYWDAMNQGKVSPISIGEFDRFVDTALNTEERGE